MRTDALLYSACRHMALLLLCSCLGQLSAHLQQAVQSTLLSAQVAVERWGHQAQPDQDIGSAGCAGRCRQITVSLSAAAWRRMTGSWMLCSTCPRGPWTLTRQPAHPCPCRSVKASELSCTGVWRPGLGVAWTCVRHALRPLSAVWAIAGWCIDLCCNCYTRCEAPPLPEQNASLCTLCGDLPSAQLNLLLRGSLGGTRSEPVLLNNALEHAHYCFSWPGPQACLSSLKR